MKICQDKNKINIYFIKCFIFIVLFFISLIYTKNVLAVEPFNVNPDLIMTDADLYQPGAGLGQMIAEEMMAIQTADKGGKWATLVQTLKNMAVEAAKKAALEWKWALKRGTAQAYKAMLRNFLNTLAYDTATYLATGDKGQNPMFETDNIGDYLKIQLTMRQALFLKN